MHVPDMSLPPECIPALSDRSSSRTGPDDRAVSNLPSQHGEVAQREVNRSGYQCC